jgi:hypothetical protein
MRNAIQLYIEKKRSKKRKLRTKPCILTRVRRQVAILRTTGAWCHRTEELRRLVELAKRAPYKRNGKRCALWYEGHWWPIRETVLTISVCDPLTREPLAGVWSL